MADERSGAGSGGFASAFDKLLEQNRQQFDRILHGPAGSSRSGAATPAAGGLPPRRRFGPLDPESSPAMRALDDRFGTDGWRYEVSERRRVGDEMIVLCRLTLPARNAVRAQFGTAPLTERGVAAEQAAVVAASEAALANCAKLL